MRKTKNVLVLLVLLLFAVAKDSWAVLDGGPCYIRGAISCINSDIRCICNYNLDSDLVWTCNSCSGNYGSDYECIAGYCTRQTPTPTPNPFDCDNLEGVCSLLIECAAISGVPHSTFQCGFASGTCCTPPSEWHECDTTPWCEQNEGICTYCKSELTSLGEKRSCEPKTADLFPGDVYNGSTGVCNTTAVNGDWCNFAQIGVGRSLCTTGSVGSTTVNATTLNWTCNGTSGGTCGGTDGADVSCSATKLGVTLPVTGVCGDYVGLPATGTRCAVGEVESIMGIRVTGIGESYSWKCNGADGTCPTVVTAPVSCRSWKCNAVNGLNAGCNSGIGGTPTQDSLCALGTFEFNSADVNHDFINDSDSTQYIWNCIGTTGTCSGSVGTTIVGCTSTINQESWYQIDGGGILAKSDIENYVPKTCAQNCATSIGGIVWSGGNFSKSDMDDSKNVKSELNKLTNVAPNFKLYSYSGLNKSYFLTKGVGKAMSLTDVEDRRQNWSMVKLNVGETGIVYIDGNLVINENIDSSNFLMLVVSGDVNIDVGVSKVNAIILADKVEATGDSNNQLVIKGMIYAKQGVSFSRSFATKSLNNGLPAVKVVYDSNLLFKFPKEVSRALSQWKNI